MALKIFIDFDGTISKNDVGNAFFREFGGEICTSSIAEYRSERISAKELFRREVASIGLLDVQKAREFLQRQQIDESFRRLVEFCRAKGIELRIVSDGLDYYIGAILSRFGLDAVSFFANRFELINHENPDFVGTTPCISFPYDDAECTRCACCKRNIMLTKSGEEDLIVYVGEGYSDRCPVQYADVVFAKDDLQKFCQQKNISYFLYRSFDDVVERLQVLHAKKRIRLRREAEMKRREAFMSE
jgi:2,3-diketo-5-methylthio-1-phosphopentane phosphatase